MGYQDDSLLKAYLNEYEGSVAKVALILMLTTALLRLLPRLRLRYNYDDDRLNENDSYRCDLGRCDLFFLRTVAPS